MLSIKSIYKDMLEFGEISSTRKFSPAEITNILRLFIGDSDIKLKTLRDRHLSNNQVVISGSYDPVEDESNFSSITIYVSYSTTQKNIYIRSIDWSQLCIDLIECTGHELIHQNQYRERGYNPSSSFFVGTSTDDERRGEQEYLGCTDEIEAFGYSIAADVYLNVGPKKLSYKHIAKTAMFKEYSAAFGSNHPIIHQLIEFASKYYIQLQGDKNAKEPGRIVLQ